MIPALLMVALLQASQPSAKDGALRLRLDSLDGRSRQVAAVAILADGRLSCEMDGHPQSVSLEEISRIIPLHDPIAPIEQDEVGCRIFYLAAGGRLSGTIQTNNEPTERVLKLQVGLPVQIDLPIEALAAVRLAQRLIPDAQRQFEARLADRPVDKDLLFVVRGDQTVVLPGALERLTAQEWEFKLGSRTQKAALDAAYGIVLGGPKCKTPSAPAVIRFGAENELAGRIVSADRATLTFNAGLPSDVHIPWTSIQSIALKSDRLVYLSDLPPTTQRAKSVLDIDLPPRMDRSVIGGPMSIRGRRFNKGLGVHAYTSLTYKLDGQFERLLATAGIDDSAAPNGSVIFRVLLDGKPAYESKVVRGGDGPQPISIDVSGAAVLTLECDDAGDLDVSDHADWADAALVRAGTSTLR